MVLTVTTIASGHKVVSDGPDSIDSETLAALHQGADSHSGGQLLMEESHVRTADPGTGNAVARITWARPGRAVS